MNKFLGSALQPADDTVARALQSLPCRLTVGDAQHTDSHRDPPRRTLYMTKSARKYPPNSMSVIESTVMDEALCKQPCIKTRRTRMCREAHLSTPRYKFYCYIFTVMVDRQFACSETPRPKLFHLHIYRVLHVRGDCKP